MLSIEKKIVLKKASHHPAQARRQREQLAQTAQLGMNLLENMDPEAAMQLPHRFQGVPDHGGS